MTPRASIRTARLILRPVVQGDAAAITEHFQNWDVIRWLTPPPWPYRLSDAETFLAGEMSRGQCAIETEGALIGVVGVTLELGYWLAPAFQGRGFMTEAAAALLDDYFAAGAESVVSGYHDGNNRSRRVLMKLGFAGTHSEVEYARPVNRKVTIHRMVLNRATWLGRGATVRN